MKIIFIFCFVVLFFGMKASAQFVGKADEETAAMLDLVEEQFIKRMLDPSSSIEESVGSCLEIFYELGIDARILGTDLFWWIDLTNHPEMLQITEILSRERILYSEEPRYENDFLLFKVNGILTDPDTDLQYSAQLNLYIIRSGTYSSSCFLYRADILSIEEL